MANKKEERRLNVDVTRAVSEFADIAKEFELREKLWRIIFRGKALEFDSYRYYNPDDDAENIDWKASKRSDRLLVKQYVEERDLDILFVVDVGENMVFGSTDKLKCEYAAELIAAMSSLIMAANDKAGLLLFNYHMAGFLKPNRGKFHFYRMNDILSSVDTYSGFSRVDSVMDFILEYPKKMLAAVIFVSDFINLGQGLLEDLLIIADKVETMAMMVRDPLDISLKGFNKEVVLEDPATGKQLLVNPGLARELYDKNAKEQLDYVRSVFKKAGIDFLELITDKYFPLPLAEFLKERVRQRGAFF